MLKYSRQRESIKQNLASRVDHPTSEMIYEDIRKEHPHVSLGTVYRNLTLLAEMGEIVKLSTGNGPDRFDFNTEPHAHFVCRNCGRVEDILLEHQEQLNDKAAAHFSGRIDRNQVFFYGSCEHCLSEQ